MENIGIFFGSDTGNTERIATVIHNILGTNISDIYDIAISKKEDIEKYEKLFFGIPTWYYGEPQCDWDDFFPILKNINFSQKILAIFGCGDQEDYSEYFCDAMGYLRDIVTSRGGTLVGKWPTCGYYFNASKGLMNENYFIGLAIDEDRQPELTQKRIYQWMQQIYEEMGLNLK